MYEAGQPASTPGLDAPHACDGIRSSLARNAHTYGLNKCWNLAEIWPAHSSVLAGRPNNGTQKTALLISCMHIARGFSHMYVQSRIGAIVHVRVHVRLRVWVESAAAL